MQLSCVAYEGQRALPSYEKFKVDRHRVFRAARAAGGRISCNIDGADRRPRSKAVATKPIVAIIYPGNATATISILLSQ